ncbi:hypothetical protein [Chitinophaga sp. MM2321]|uniref:hypothetical protein n=1 Tax=Chitinophaga sp. MM2321 TaxID=3137178 RepID=UPI0032D56A21
MADKTNNIPDQYQVPRPNPALRSLDVLVGTWNMTGRDFSSHEELRGQFSFEWMEGGFFLVQHIHLVHSKGIEIIGYDELNRVCTSHSFDNMGSAFTYTYVVTADTIIIRGLGFLPGISTTTFDLSPGAAAVFRGRISKDRNTITGAWKWPGGGFSATSTRVGYLSLQ